MLKRVVMLMCAVALSGVTLGAQAKPAATPRPKPAAAEEKQTPAPAKAAPAEQALPLNIKIEVTITDQIGSNPGGKKVVSMIVGDRQSTSIRSNPNRLVTEPISISHNGPPTPTTH